MKENKYFPWVVTLAALAVSSSAAYYSVYGIGKMFAGASTNVMIMAGSLEFSKLVIASLLYRFWDDINKGLRAYLTVACFLLICITSAGIYGFLSAAYQETANKIENIDKKSGVMSKESAMVQREIASYEKQIELKNNRLTSLSDLRGKQQTTMDNLIGQGKSISSIKKQIDMIDNETKRLDAEVAVLSDSVMSKNKKISDIDLKTLDIETNNDLANEVGPLKYIAKITGKTLDQVVNWFIIVLMLVFDPLAIALVIASNFIFNYVASKKTPENDGPVDPIEPEVKEEEIEEEIEEETEKEIEVFTVEDNLYELEEEPQGSYGLSDPDTEIEESQNEEEEVHEEATQEGVQEEQAFVIGETQIPEETVDEIIEEQTEGITETSTEESVDEKSHEPKENIQARRMGFAKLGNVYHPPVEVENHPASPTRLS
jgi:hypothetical protein